MNIINTRSGNAITVDERDYEYVSKFKWHIKNYCGLSYAIRRPYIRGRKIIIFMHREILKPAYGLEVDHIDGNGLNNARSNLRVASRAENGRNIHRVRAKSGFKGVRFDKGAWRADISSDKLGSKYLGRFSNKLDAARAYDKAARTLFGSNACTNEDLGLFSMEFVK